MKALQLFVITTIIVSCISVTGASAAYYIVQNNMGTRAVTDSLPGYGWTVMFGPYASKDAAIRDMGTGTVFLPGDIRGEPAPSVTSAGRIIPRFMASDINFEEFEASESMRPSMRAEAPNRNWQRPAARGSEAPADRSFSDQSAEMSDMAVFALKGKSAIDLQGKDLGRFESLVVARDGRVDYVVLSHENKLVPIPWRSVEISPQKDALVVHADKKQLSSAPSVNRRDFLHSLASADFRDKIHSFYESGAMNANARSNSMSVGAHMEAPEMQKSADENAAINRHMQEAQTPVENPQDNMQR